MCGLPPRFAFLISSFSPENTARYRFVWSGKRGQGKFEGVASRPTREQLQGLKKYEAALFPLHQGTDQPLALSFKTPSVEF